jgi:hypothetical protein
MALPHEFDKVLERVTRITGDLKFTRWSKLELIDYINEGQKEYCEKSMILRAESPLTVRENSEIYTLPDDCFIVDRIERGDGDVVTKTTSRDLGRGYGGRQTRGYNGGANYRKERGNPIFYYQDLDGQRQLRFYPIPDSSVLSTYRQIDSELGAIIRYETSQQVEPLIVDGVQVVDTENPLFISTAVSEEFDSEVGVTIDSEVLEEDGTDVNHFNHEEGAVISVLSTEGAFRIWYVRYPRENIAEINDLQALQYYTLHKCYEKDGPLQNFEVSRLYEGKFRDRLNEEIGRVSSGQHAEMSVRGSYE